MNDPSQDRREFWFLDTRVAIRVSFKDGDNEMSVLEQWLPYGDSPPLHLHRDQDEIFHLIAGEMQFRVGGRDLRARGGDTLLAPRAVPHAYRVTSREGAHVLVVTRGGQFESFVLAMSRLAEREGLPVPAGPPAASEMAALVETAARYGIEVVGPPLS